VTTVFPKVPDYICHFHFLRDIGKDLFDFEYRTIRRYTRSFNIRVTLNKVEKVLQPLFGLIVLTLIFLPKNKELKNKCFSFILRSSRKRVINIKGR